MPNVKYYVITSITLGLIAASSAGLIGLANYLTAEKIKKNEQEKITSGIRAIFGENASIEREEDLSNFKYTNHLYVMKDNEGLAFRVTGSNMYGKISLIVGFSGSSYDFRGMYMVTDEQTYASTLEDNYITTVNKGERDIDDVSCGATYGATLVKDMINDAKNAALELNKD